MTYYALVPAAGGGSRMGAAKPKQYLPLFGRPMIYHALATLCSAASISRVLVVLAPDDAEWERYDWSDFADRLTVARCGGATRAASVANGLALLPAADEDWVLVHDAARVCVTLAHIEKLISEVGDDAVGGLLATPVADTLKRATTQHEARAQGTVPRAHLWQAQTPQMFRCGLLKRALAQNTEVTDEAGAIEALGLAPKLVAGDMMNFKVTYPLDLHLAGLILSHGYPIEMHLNDLRLRAGAAP